MFVETLYNLWGHIDCLFIIMLHFNYLCATYVVICIINVSIFNLN